MTVSGEERRDFLADRGFLGEELDIRIHQHDMGSHRCWEWKGKTGSGPCGGTEARIWRLRIAENLPFMDDKSPCLCSIHWQAKESPAIVSQFVNLYNKSSTEAR